MQTKKNWDSYIFNYLWITIGICSGLTLLNLAFSSLLFQPVLFLQFLIPLVLQIVIVLTLKYLVRLKVRAISYYFVIGTLAIVSIVITFYFSLFKVLLSLFLLPIFIAIFFLDQRTIRFAFLLTLTLFSGLTLWFIPFQGMAVIEYTSFFAILLSAYFLARELTKRYALLYGDMIVSAEKGKELLYRNIYMEKLTKMDLATNLYNHRTFHEYLDELVAQYQNQPFNLSLGLMDLDHFKGINDRQGHGNGDVVIEKAAEIILNHLEPNDFAARYGGEEFAVIFTEKSPDACLEILERIRKSLEDAIFETMPDEMVTMSIGFAHLTPEMSKTDLFEIADAKLYVAKESGRNQIQCA